MKKSFIATFIVFAPYKKEAPNSILGNWELRVVYGGWSGTREGHLYSLGNSDIFKFTDTTFQHYLAGRLINSGTYTKTKDTSIVTGKFMDAVQLENSKVYYELHKDTLTMYLGGIESDGSIEKFVRQ